MTSETSTSLDEVKIKLDAKDGKVNDVTVLNKLKDDQATREFFYNSGKSTLKDYLQRNPEEKQEFTDLCKSILADPKNKELLKKVSSLKLDAFSKNTLEGLEEPQKTERQKLQSLVMMASLYLWLKKGEDGNFDQVRDFADNDLASIIADVKKTEVKLGAGPEDKTENVEEVEEVEEEAKENTDKKAATNNTEKKETHDFLKDATVDKGTIYHGYGMEFDNTTGKVTATKDGKQGVVTFTNFTGLGYGGHTFGKATVGGEELSVHIYKKVATPESKNYIIDINPQKIHLNETRINLKNLIQTDYTLSSEKVTDKTKNVEVQDTSGKKVQLKSQSAYIYERTILGNSPRATVLPDFGNAQTTYLRNTGVTTSSLDLNIPDRTEKVINLGGKFYKNISGPRDTNIVYKEISATQTSAEEIKTQQEQEKKKQETEKSYDSLNTGLDTFGTELLGRGKLFDNVTFRGHLETFAKGSQEALKKGVKDVLGKNYYESKHPLKNIVDNFPGVITIKDGKPSFDLKKLKDDKGSLNEIGKQLKTLMTTLFSVVGDQFALLVTALEKDKGKIVGSDKEVENKFATVTTILSDVKTKITTGLSYLNNEGTFLMLLEHVNHLSSDTKAGASLENGLSGVKSSILTSSEKIYNNTESMLDTYSLINTFASGKVENMGPRMKKFLQETTPVTINGQTIYCNKKQLEKNKFKVEQDGKITKEGKPADQLLLDARKRGDIYGESVSQLVGTLYGNDNCTVLTKNKEDIRFKSDAEQKAWLEGLHLSKDSPLLGEIDNEKIVGSTNLTNYIKKHYQNDLPADEDRLVTRIESDTYPVVTLTDKLVSTPLPGKDTLVADLYKVKVIKGDSTDFVYVPKKTLEKSLKSYTEKLDTTDQAVVQESTLQEARDLMPDPLALFGQKYGIETKHWNTDPSKLNSILVGSGDSQFSIDIANGEKPTLVLPVTYGGFATTDVRVDCDAKTIKSSLDNATTLMDHYQKIVAYRKLSENNKDTYPRNTPQNNTMKFLEQQAGALVKGTVDKGTCEKYGFTVSGDKKTFALNDIQRDNKTNTITGFGKKEPVFAKTA